MKHILTTLILCSAAFTLASAGKRPEPVLLFNQKGIETQTLKTSVQGTAIFGDYLFSMRDKGNCVVINIADKSLVSEFALASAGEMNHANDAFFSDQYYDSSDRFPLLYVSQCKNEPVAELNRPECAALSRLLFVERVICDREGKPTHTELVQVISYQPEKWNSRLFVFDSTTPDRLYCYGNTVGNCEPGNRIIVETLPMPKLDRSRLLVTIDPEACVNRFYVDEALPEGHRGPQNNILQGGYAYKGLLFLPVGVGTAEHPSELFGIDLVNRDSAGKPCRYFYADYNDIIPCEMEDVDLWKGKWLICTTNSHGRVRPVFSFPINKFKFLQRK